MLKYIFLAAALVVPVEVFGSEIDDVKEAIKEFIVEMPAHPLNRNEGKLTIVAQALLDAESITSLDWELFTVIGYRESSFKRKALGERGERGIMQINRDARKYCKRVIGKQFNAYNYKDNIICGALWFKVGMEECNNTIRQGLAKYSSRRTCNPKKGTKRLKYAVKSRMRQYEKLQKKYDSKE